MPPKKNKHGGEPLAVLVAIGLILIPLAIIGLCSSEQKTADVKKMTIEDLQTAMNNAAAEEDYLLAAFYRDEIKKRKALSKTA